MNFDLHIIPVGLLEPFCQQVGTDVQERFNTLRDSELSIGTFSFYTSVSAVFSSKIEGEDIELDSFVKHKRFGAHFLADYTRKTDDLYDAYKYAQQNKLSEGTIFDIHTFITRHILQSAQQGKICTGNMFVLTSDGRIEYVAATPGVVKKEMDALVKDIDRLLTMPLSFNEVLFFAAMIHLVFVKIHPFEDGNGRTARLLEKWFLAQKLGKQAWFVESEKHYYAHHQTYYHHLRALGLEYDTLDYSQALPFLLLLPGALHPQQ